jgi:hypothetical protein
VTGQDRLLIGHRALGRRVVDQILDVTWPGIAVRAEPQ